MSLAWIWRRYEICVKIRWIERLATFMPFENNWHFNELFICVYWERWINLMVGESDECEEVLMMIRGSKLSIYRILWFSMTHSIKMKYLELSSMVSVLNGWLCSLALSPYYFSSTSFISLLLWFLCLLLPTRHPSACYPSTRISCPCFADLLPKRIEKFLLFLN